MQHTPTTFYSASAGSGKTYTLARDYLTLLFKNPYNNGYREILAITFTNKAVAEMKQRILENLHQLTFKDVPENLVAIRDHIMNETGLDQEQVTIKANKIEQKLLHDYAAFDIVTIDSFNHRILRTFAREINLPDGFTIELDSNRLISKGIHNLLSRAGKEKQLTDLLVKFSLSKIDNGKSWDIEYDLYNLATLILSESHYGYIQKLQKKSIADFKQLGKKLNDQITTAEEDLINKANFLLDHYKSCGLAQDDFTGKSRGIYGWLKKIGNGNIPADGQQNYLEKALTQSIVADNGKSGLVDEVQDQLINLINTFREVSAQIALNRNVSSSLTALSLLNELMQEINGIKDDEQIVPIYEFNGILSRQIKDEPAPFIYERLGERYRHYFIDEFQDTSRMQWENLKPLIENPLVQLRDDGATGSLMLVGDAKQSIYRWRGGDADQFLGLLGIDRLFLQPKTNITLGTNWRSFDTIIHFNNEFFKSYGSYLENEKYQDLYLNYLNQETNDKTGGYVQVDFLDIDQQVPDDLTSTYPIHVKRQIDQALSSGFQPNEICILVRKKKQGDELARYLVEHNLSVVSSDSLLVSTSPRVQLLVQFMKMCFYPGQREPRFTFLLQYALLFEISNIHGFIEQYIDQELSVLMKNLLNDKDEVHLAFAKAPLFQATENAASSLGLFDHHDIRLQAFLEYVYEVGSGFETSTHHFIESWEMKKDGLSVPATEDPTAIQIMTIHKSKGLEFPVVIVPYCDVPLEEIRDATGWLPVDPEEYLGFEDLYISLKKECLQYSDRAAALYNEEVFKNQMDQINTLYVAFTRAKEQLYISCFENLSSKQKYSDLLKKFVEGKSLPVQQFPFHNSYKLGHISRTSLKTPLKQGRLMEDYVVSNGHDRLTISTRKGMLWASGADKAINAGNQLHHYLSMINNADDLATVATSISLDRSLNRREAAAMIEKISLVINYESLQEYFNIGVNNSNERAILTPQGDKAIPDRLVFDSDLITIIDYKTGNKKQADINQLNHYETLLIDMNYKVKEKVLIYTDDLEIIKWK